MHGLRYFLRSCLFVTLIALVTVSLGSCSQVKNQLTMDRAADKNLQDYRDALAPAPLPAADVAAAPDFKPMVSVPDDLKLPSPLVTVSVNQTVSLRDLMFELAEQAGVDMELDPQIHGSIIFTAKDRPFNDVVNRICEMAGLRYKFQNNVLRVELDRPYLKNYKVDYMNVSRKSDTSINNSISTTGSSSNSTAASGSNANIDNSYSSDMWKDIEDGLNQILLASDTYLSLATLSDPVATASGAAAQLPPSLPANLINNPGAPPGAPAMNPPSLPTNSPAINVAQSQEAPALANPPATYSVSRQTGVVSVFATERQHRQVKKFLDTIHRSTTTQVLIEAKVLEVALTDEFASGIDWSSVNAAVRANFSSPGFTPTATSIFTAKLGIGEGTHPIISALSRFGTVRALSSPRVTVMNNQPAVVNVSENKVYFTIQVTSIPQTGVSPGPPTVTYNTTQQSVPEGVLLNVIPTANAETGEIILAVRPTVTKEVTTVDDPVIKLTNPTLDVTSKIPQMSVQEMDSIVKMQSGQTVVMGGLMKDENVVSEEGVPIIGSIPLIGTLFHNHGDRIQKTELVIFLTSTIIPGANVDDMDRKIYDGFGQDRRPVKL